MLTERRWMYVFNNYNPNYYNLIIFWPPLRNRFCRMPLSHILTLTTSPLWNYFHAGCPLLADSNPDHLPSMILFPCRLPPLSRFYPWTAYPLRDYFQACSTKIIQWKLELSNIIMSTMTCKKREYLVNINHM